MCQVNVIEPVLFSTAITDIICNTDIILPLITYIATCVDLKLPMVSENNMGSISAKSNIEQNDVFESLFVDYFEDAPEASHQPKNTHETTPEVFPKPTHTTLETTPEVFPTCIHSLTIRTLKEKYDKHNPFTDPESVLHDDSNTYVKVPNQDSDYVKVPNQDSDYVKVPNQDSDLLRSLIRTP